MRRVLQSVYSPFNHHKKKYHKRAVHEFGERNKHQPKRIVFFRDGLSEGEYANLVLVPVHTSQRANVRENVLRCVCEPESIDIAKAELSINDELRKTQDFSTQVESVEKTKLSYAQVRMARDMQVGLAFKFSIMEHLLAYSSRSVVTLLVLLLILHSVDGSSTMKHEDQQPRWLETSNLTI